MRHKHCCKQRTQAITKSTTNTNLQNNKKITSWSYRLRQIVTIPFPEQGYFTRELQLVGTGVPPLGQVTINIYIFAGLLV